VGDRNLFGSGDAGKVSVTLGQYTKAIDLSLTDPRALGNASLGGDLFAKETTASTYQSYGMTLYGGKIVTDAPLTDTLSTELRYTLYDQAVTLDPTSTAVPSLPIQQAALAGPMWVSSIGTGLTYSTVDDPRHPRDGIRSSFNEDFAGLGGDAKFVKGTEDFRIYREIAPDTVALFRAQGGAVAPWGGGSVPLLNGFFGGPQFVRGFAPNGFGPRDLTPGTTMDNLGGTMYWATTAEVQSPLPFVPPEIGLKGAIFADAGSVWGTSATSAGPALSGSLQIADSRAIRASAGVGLVWDSIFGPMRVDYAYPLRSQPYDVTQRLHFGVNGF
jgi:outer membrane protein insertion porin family